MSRRRRELRQRSLRLQVTQRKARRRRARLAAAAPVAAVATSAALVLSGSAASATPTSRASEGRQWPAAAAKSNVRPAPRSACGSPRTPASYSYGFVGFKGRTFFTGYDGVHGRQLWKTDGTDAGTVMVTDIGQGRSRFPGGVSYLTLVGSTLFFVADDGVHGRELWRSDGTRAGTAMVKDVDPGDSYGAYGPSDLTAVGTTLFFVTDDGTHGRELWTSDGTRAGTAMVRDISKVKGEYAPAPTGLAASGGRLFFADDDGVHGQELWRSDGTRAGTVMVEDITPAGADSYYTGPYGMTDVDGTLFFTDDDGVNGRELWTSDGSAVGTTMVEDIRPGTYDSDAADFVAVGSTLFFTARDGVHGRELWTSDGTVSGTTLVKDLNGDARASGTNSLTRVGDEVFFAGDDGAGPGLWKSNGTAPGTTMVSPVAPHDIGYGAAMQGVGSTLFFVADDDVHGPELWKSDGTEAGTVLVRDITPGNPDTYYDYGPVLLTDVAGKLYFAADDGVHGWEPWRSDGTRAGTTQVRDVNAGGGFSLPKRGAANQHKGTVALPVRVEGAGHLVAGPAGERLVRTTHVHATRAGRTRVTLTPTAAGMRKLRHALRVAHRHGKHVGKVPVAVRFTFTPCGGEPSSQVRRYTLQLR